MKSVTTHEAKTHLSALLRDVEQGTEVEIRRGDLTIARLVPARPTQERKRPRVGTVTSAPARYEPDAFAPMSQAEMEQAGLV